MVKCFAKAPEIERKAMTGLVVEWSKRLDLNFRAQFNAKAREELVATKAAVTDWFGRTPTCVAAALACASMPQIKAMNRRGQLPPEIIVDILKDRRPPWIADYAEWLCEGGAWKCARALVVAGLCAPPKHDN